MGLCHKITNETVTPGNLAYIAEPVVIVMARPEGDGPSAKQCIVVGSIAKREVSMKVSRKFRVVPKKDLFKVEVVENVDGGAEFWVGTRAGRTGGGIDIRVQCRLQSLVLGLLDCNLVAKIQ
jgi:hypothetical protein